MPVLRFEAKDVERALGGHRALVRTVGRRERVVDVGDRHHPRLHRDLLLADAARIPGAVELLVVAEGDLRDPAQLPRPRDLFEEPIRVRDVRLDLAAFTRVEVALVDHEEPQFVLGEQGPLDAVEIHEGLPTDLLEFLERPLGEDRRFVRAHDRVEPA